MLETLKKENKKIVFKFPFLFSFFFYLQLKILISRSLTTLIICQSVHLHIIKLAAVAYFLSEKLCFLMSNFSYIFLLPSFAFFKKKDGFLLL